MTLSSKELIISLTAHHQVGTNTSYEDIISRAAIELGIICSRRCTCYEYIITCSSERLASAPSALYEIIPAKTVYSSIGDSSSNYDIVFLSTYDGWTLLRTFWCHYQIFWNIKSLRN